MTLSEVNETIAVKSPSVEGLKDGATYMVKIKLYENEITRVLLGEHLQEFRYEKEHLQR